MLEEKASQISAKKYGIDSKYNGILSNFQQNKKMLPYLKKIADSFARADLGRNTSYYKDCHDTIDNVLKICETSTDLESLLSFLNLSQGIGDIGKMFSTLHSEEIKNKLEKTKESEQQREMGEQKNEQAVTAGKYLNIKYRPKNPTLATKCSSILNYYQAAEAKFGETDDLPKPYADLIFKVVNDAIKECKTQEDLEELGTFLEEAEELGEIGEYGIAIYETNIRDFITKEKTNDSTTEKINENIAYFNEKYKNAKTALKEVTSASMIDTEKLQDVRAKFLTLLGDLEDLKQYIPNESYIQLRIDLGEQIEEINGVLSQLNEVSKAFDRI